MRLEGHAALIQRIRLWSRARYARLDLVAQSAAATTIDRTDILI